MLIGSIPSLRREARQYAQQALQLPASASWGNIRERIADFKMRGCPVAHDVEARLEDLLDGARPYA